ncbi:alanine racemase [Nocardia cyriacigeorgica]|uniref:alanine racemase n=1 Tax=Nocardia cyriacigeorgica TaxID=135487 RepID=UPI001032DED2|nr:alanine racemase [Nocardia cyriacigeorgica]MBF6200034.1 alanine racemase [Nocardia cyriacigeorgica]MBF6343799.1 alanine racemase [Nocardia cyriacigeorgica]MBF6516490.1 alanine racemase [Nocardia cyriacigeorgica]
MAGSGIVNAQVETVVDLDAIAHNVRILREHAGGAAVMIVVKADGYNHGAVEVGRAALAAGAAELGVTTISEAVQLREAGITAPILSWLNNSDADYGAAIAADIEIGVSSLSQLRGVEAAARRLGRTATLTLKVDTGLNRNGVSVTEYRDVLTALRGLVDEQVVRFRAIFSHLAHADEPHHPIIDVQRDRFVEAIATAKEYGLEPEIRHLANSAATLTRPDLAFDMVRPGIAVYGLSPVPELGDFGLRPAMTFQAQVSLIKQVAAGEGVSYGHEWIAPHDTTVALIPAGYADGVARKLGGRFEVWVRGARRPSIGRVCMDQLVVDLGENLDGVTEGDTAVLFGTGENGQPHAQEWADLLETIHYEVVCSPRGRAVRRFRGGLR